MTYKVLDAYVLHHAVGNGSPNGKFYQAWVVSDGVEFWALANWGARTEAPPRNPPNGQVAMLSKCDTREQALALVRSKVQAKKGRGYFDYTQFGEAAGIELVSPSSDRWLALLPTPVPTPDAGGKTEFMLKVDELLGQLQLDFLAVNLAIDGRSPHVHSFRAMYQGNLEALVSLLDQARQYHEILSIKTAAMMATPAKPPAKAPAKPKKVDNLDTLNANLKGLIA